MVTLLIVILMLTLTFPLHWNTAYFRETFASFILTGIALLVMLEIIKK